MVDEDDVRRDSLREGLRVKGRTGRKSGARRAEAEKGSRHRRNDILPSLRIEPYPVDALKSHVRKLRMSDPAHIREIANSVSTLGFNVPLLVGKDNVVVDGDSRLEAAKLLGLSSVPCIRVDHLDETEQRLLRLAVNRLGEKGFWDVGELEAEFKELIIADVPIEISGFGSDEIDQVVIGGNDDGCEAGDLAPLPGASASARVGLRISGATVGRPPRRRDFHRQYDLNPARCHLITVSGFTIAKAPNTFGAKRYKPANIRRSSIPNVGRFGDFRRNTLS